MIVGIGVDAVAIKRFAQWHTYPRTMLSRIFSEHEIDYCLRTPKKSAERFAARFATREATFKALQSLLFTFGAKIEVPFLRACKAITIYGHDNGLPRLQIDWHHLGIDTLIDGKNIVCHVSISHTAHDAISYVIIEC